MPGKLVSHRRACRSLMVAVGLLMTAPAIRADVGGGAFKDDNTINLNMATSWVAGQLPDATHTAGWDSTVTGANTTILGSSPTWLGITEYGPGTVSNPAPGSPGGLVTIGVDGNAITLLSAGIDMATYLPDQPFTINADIVLGADQSWNILSPAVLTVGGNVSLGSHTLTVSADGTNSINGAISGSGGLIKSNGGTLILGGASDFSAPLTVNGGAVEFSHTQSVGTISGASGTTVQVDAGQTVTSDLVGLDALVVNGTDKIRANSSLTHRTSTINTLTLAGAPGAWTGKLDLTNNNLIVTSDTNAANQIKQAAALGTWTGSGGITSSAAQAAATGSTATGLAYATGAEYTTATGNTMFDSKPFQATDTLIKYTLAGDANMDGAVTFADFLALQNNYNKAGDWSQGDWNYDGQVTFADFLILQNNYNKTLAVGSVMPAISVAAAPEPGSLVLAALGCVGLLARRKVRKAGGGR